VSGGFPCRIHYTRSVFLLLLLFCYRKKLCELHVIFFSVCIVLFVWQKSRLWFYFSIPKQEQNMLQLQQCSVIKTVAKKVFENCLSQKLHWTRQFKIPFCNTFTCLHSLRLRQVSSWIQVSIQIWNVSSVDSIFYKIRRYADVFYFRVRVSWSHLVII